MTMIAFPKRPPLIKTALLGGVAVVASAWAAGPASAEGTVNADAPTDTEYASAEITVTARKREERIQDVPLSIRSEEHTSELQSLMRISYAVFCLKTKKTTKIRQYTN